MWVSPLAEVEDLNDETLTALPRPKIRAFKIAANTWQEYSIDPRSWTPPIMRNVERILETAAKHKLVVHFHTGYLPGADPLQFEAFMNEYGSLATYQLVHLGEAIAPALRLRLLDDTAADPLADEEPVLAVLTAASVRGLIAPGARTGQRLRRVLKDPATGVRTAPLCFASRGFSLHAARRIAGPDRRGLERLCRYVARPALASGRLRLLASQRLCFALKTPWSDGTSHLLLSPMELLEKLAALVPPPRLHLLRYHGVLAPRARDRGRGRIVLAKPVAEPSAADGDASAPSCAHPPGVGGPAGPGVWRRPQPMRSRWRAPEDHRRPDRSDLDPDLSGGGRAAGGAPAEGPAAAAVRVRGLTSPPFAPGAVSRREECVLNGLIEYRIGPATGPQTTKPYCEPCQRTCKRSSASLPCPLGVFGALTRGPKRCLILPILRKTEENDPYMVTSGGWPQDAKITVKSD